MHMLIMLNQNAVMDCIPAIGAYIYLKEMGISKN